MLVTLLVSKLLKSSEVSDSHPRNIESILKTLLVSKLLRSSEVSDLQFSNI